MLAFQYIKTRVVPNSSIYTLFPFHTLKTRVVPNSFQIVLVVERKQMREQKLGKGKMRSKLLLLNSKRVIKVCDHNAKKVKET